MKRWGSWIPLVFLLGLAGWIWWLDQPPAVRPLEAPPTEFSAARAMIWVQRLAREPHRSGTRANDAIRAELITALRGLGLTVVTDEPTVVRDTRIANPRNIYGRLPGRRGAAPGGNPAASSAFLLMAHYDSVPYGPGAADDLSGVAAILETLRALEAGSPLENDLLVAFTDGEECGLLGGKAFGQHPWAREVGCMLNFEARGMRGPSYLFEFGGPQTWLLQEIAQSGAPLRTSSLMYEVHRRLPFTTDYTMLRDSIPGMNAAFVGRFPLYHSANDTPQHLDPRSLQHHGEYALSFTRRFCSLPPSGPHPTTHPVFFTVFGSHLVWYPEWLNSALTIILTIAVILYIFRGGRIRALRMALKAGFFVLFWGTTASLIPAAIGVLTHGPFLLYQNWSFILAGLSLGSAIALGLFIRYRRTVDGRSLHVAALALWGLGMIVQYFLLPAGLFLWQWPLAAGLFGALGMKIVRPGLVFPLVAPVLLGFGIPLFAGLGEAICTLALPGMAAWFLLASGLFLPWLDRSLRRLHRPLTILFLILGTGGFLHGIVGSAPSPDCPRMTHLIWQFDLDAGESRWCSLEATPADWTRAMLTSAAIRLPLEETPDQLLWQSPPTPASGIPPLAEIIENRVSANGARFLNLRLIPPPDTQRMLIHGSSTAKLKQVMVNGVEVEARGRKWNLDYSILPGTPIELSVRLQTNASLTLRLTAIGYERLHDVLSRPSGIIPMNNVLNRGSKLESDTTRIRRRFLF